MRTGVIVLRLLFIYFLFWDGMQLSNIPIKNRIVHSYVHGLLDCSCHILSLPAYDLEVFHRTFGERYKEHLKRTITNF